MFLIWTERAHSIIASNLSFDVFNMSRGFQVCFVAFVTRALAGGAPAAPVEDSRLWPQYPHQVYE